jgi:hypothetical protein
MAPKTITIGEMAADDVYQTVISKGLTQSEAASFVAEWILVSTGKSKRVFAYKQAFAATVPTCGSNFARSFAHTDWVDGESVVQASQTTGELGFNERFHRIETDLDALGTNVAMAFSCLATMRTELKNLLEEIRVELNKINGDIDACCNKSGPTIYPGPIVDIPKFAGKIQMQDRFMQVWETKAGMILLPDIAAVEAAPWTNPRAERAGPLARFIEEDPRVKQTFTAAVTKKQFVEKFGNERLADGTLVRELVMVLPDTARYGNLESLTNDVVEREAAALKTTAGVTEAISTSLGLGTDAQKIGAVPITSFGALKPAAREALARKGVDTLEKFVALTGAQTQELLRSEQVTDVSAGDVAEAALVAKTLMKLK